ncbi:HD domain-containing protein [Candidatus Sumerlaeota bacterium]|nr:HD domain-containing protein [Candidatus Sumerlaeota bacterium]
MNNSKIRRELAHAAALLIYEGHESEYARAKRKAARQLNVPLKGPTGDLPSDAEVHDALLDLARLHEGEGSANRLAQMRQAALEMMRELDEFQPRLTGSVLSGKVREGSDVNLHVYTEEHEDIGRALDALGTRWNIEHKQITRCGKPFERLCYYFDFQGFEFELAAYEPGERNHRGRSSITGKTIECATTRELERLMEERHPDSVGEVQPSMPDLWQSIRALLENLSTVRENTRWHPEGNALIHSLQVFELAREHRPRDREFLLAALLHDVGKGLDSSHHAQAALDALDGLIERRTAWLIEHHMVILDYRRGRLSDAELEVVARSPWFSDLELLRRIDDAGRDPGAQTCTLDEALDFLRAIGS